MTRRRRGRRGAALVLVLIFAVGALMLATTMLTITDKTAQQQGELQRHRNLQAVLKAGIAAAMNEINRHGSLVTGSYDQNNDGVGAFLGTGNAGIEVTVDNAAGQTTSLGWYRATVRQDSGTRQTLVVVAAWPSFDAPPTGEVDRRMFAAAELDIESQENTFYDPDDESGAGPYRPINIVNVSASDLIVQIINNPKVNVQGKDTNPSGHPTPTKANVPGANITSTDAKNEFNTNFTTNSSVDTFSGADPTDLNGPIVTGTATVTQSESTVFNETTMTNARTTYQTDVKNKVNAALAGTANYSQLSGGAFDGGGTPTALPGSGPGKVVIADDGLTIKGKVTGEGTLIVRDTLKIEGDFTWNGDIIVAGYDNPDTSGNHDIVNNSVLEVTSGGKIYVKGTTVNLGNSSMTFRDQSSAGGGPNGTSFDGAFLMLGNENNTTEAKFYPMNGSNTLIEGALAIYSEKIDYYAENGSKSTMRSVNLVVPENDADNDNQVMVRIDGETNWIYDNTQVTESVAPILPALGGVDPEADDDDDSVTVWTTSMTKYWENDPYGVYTAQQAAITNGDTISWQKP